MVKSKQINSATHCPTCNSPVSVEGTTTHHYIPKYDKLKLAFEELLMDKISFLVNEHNATKEDVKRVKNNWFEKAGLL